MSAWPNGPLFAGPGILETITRLVSRATRSRFRSVLAELAGRAGAVVSERPRLSSPLLQERLTSVGAQIRRLDAEVPQLSRELRENLALLTSGINELDLGVRNLPASTRRRLQRFGDSIVTQASQIAGAQGDLQAAEFLATELRARPASLEAARRRLVESLGPTSRP